MNFASQSIGLKSVINARELGGYRLPGGAVVKHGLLLRGGDLANVSEEDAGRLVNRFHLTKVFDFRTSMEVHKSPDRELPGVVNIWMPAFNEEGQVMEGLSLPSEAYRDLGNWLVRNGHIPKVQEVARTMYTGMALDEFTQMQYAGFLQNIVNTPSGAVYWHCSQGKDRTGFGAALLLAALGADRKLIMKDYMISNEFYLKEVLHYCSRTDSEDVREVIRTFVGVNPVYFGNALDRIEKEHGSLLGYLKGPLCLTDEDIEVLRERYTE